MAAAFEVDLLDITALGYAERLTASALQGLANRQGPALYLLNQNYDDPGTRKTNVVHMTDDNWYKKYRAYIKDNDAANLEYYRKAYPLKTHTLAGLAEAVQKYRHLLHGVVVWDPALEDSVNLALMLAAQEGLLVIAPQQLEWARAQGLAQVRHDLRGRFTERVALYAWALRHLFAQCKPGQVACMEPHWQRSEFADYIVQNQLFVYCLSSFKKGGLRSLGQNLLMLLIGGPFGLRNFLFATHLDGAVKALARVLLGLGAPETRLGNRIQRAVKALPFPTIFGWHSERDDELTFMLQISMNGMRLAPTFMAGNYSFHSQLPAPAAFKQQYVDPQQVKLEDRVYLTFTLSDGDQFTLMNTGELGNWRRPERGKVAFNWEMQPLLAEIASLDEATATCRMQELYSEPIKPELIRERLQQIRDAGVTVAGALTPQRTQQLYETVVAAGVDLFVIRGTTVSAEHVSSVDEPLNLKKFIYDLDVPVIVGGAATYTARQPSTSCAPAPRACSSASAAGQRRRRAVCSASTHRWPRPSPTSLVLAATTWTSRAGAMST